MSELIDSNTITFNIDKDRQDWSFRYYMTNAKYRLNDLSGKFEHQNHPFNVWGDTVGITPQQQWGEVQASLEAAITSFSLILADAKTRKLRTVAVKVKRLVRHKSTKKK